MITYTYTPFEDRDVQYPGKRFITRPDSSVELCTVARTNNGQEAEGVIYNPGTPIDAQSFNDQLNNIKNVFDSIGVDLAKKQATLNAGQNVTLTPQADGTVTIDAAGGGGGASALDDLTDVDITTPANGDVLKYNAVAQKWENAAESGGGSVQPNLILGGDDLREVSPPSISTQAAYTYSHGYVIDRTSRNYTLATVSSYNGSNYFDITKDYVLKLVIEISGTRYYQEISLPAANMPLSGVTFELAGEEFVIYAITLSASNVSLYSFFTSNNITAYLAGIAVAEADPDTPQFPLDATVPQLLSILKNKLDVTTLTYTLLAGETVLNINSAYITTLSYLEVWANMYGVNVLYMNATYHNLTIVFDAQPQDITISVRVS